MIAFIARHNTARFPILTVIALLLLISLAGGAPGSV